MKTRAKVKPRVWKIINSQPSVENEDIVKRNNAIRKKLISCDWELWDSYKILEDGYTICFCKKRLELQYPKIYFSWYWDDRGFGPLFCGTMEGFYDFDTNDKSNHPRATFSVSGIGEYSLDKLYDIEDRISTAMRYQTEIITNKNLDVS